MGDLFRDGGPHQIRRTGDDQHELKVELPTDDDGRLGRECPSDECEPKYFRVKLGTGVIGDADDRLCCPYCGRESDANDLATPEQIEFAKRIAIDEAWGGVDRMVIDALELGPSGRRSIDCGLFSLEMSYETEPRPAPQHPEEETLRRDVVCPRCGLDHTVFGLANWCPDCRHDVLLVHVEQEFAAIRRIVSSIGDDRDRRLKAKILENALEDVVSAFEGSLKYLVRRVLRDRGRTPEEVERTFAKDVRNSFQNAATGDRVFKSVLGVPLFCRSRLAEQERLQELFEKRHPITHNLGVVDRKYVTKTGRAGREGRDLIVSMAEIDEAISIAASVIASAHKTLFDGRRAQDEEPVAEGGES
ncbi:MAG: hypothetical protein KDB53_04985 [Planctomycetes bacterium]|nr:hypothetical protein [Planctomycetota bacterium]